MWLLKQVTVLFTGPLSIYFNDIMQVITVSGAKSQNQILYFNSADSRVVRAFESGAADSGLVPSRVKPMTLRSVFTASLLDV